MPTDNTNHHRQSIRWKNWNYAGGGSYFVTTCSRNRVHLFGKVEATQVVLSDVGRYVLETWESMPERFPEMELDAYQVMPNHVHAVLHLNRGVELGDVVGAFKSLAFKRHYDWLKDTGLLLEVEAKIWQRNYWEHVIRDERELHKCRVYIENNPANWAEDEENLNRLLARMTERKSR